VLAVGEESSAGRPRLTVDVVLCAYTEQRWELLQRSVASVQRQSVAPRNVILCIDHNDRLAERCLKQWPAGRQTLRPFVQVVRNRFDGRLGSSRNTGFELVTADIVAFLDDDAEADTSWLERLLDVYRDPRVVAVGGAPQPVFETSRPAWFPREFDWVFGCHYSGLPEELAPVRHLIGASMSVRSAALRRIGGFRSDNHDDMDLSHRIAAEYGKDSVVYEPKARVYHFVTADRVRWGYFWRRCFRVNRGKVRAFDDMGSTSNLHAELAFARRATLRLVQRLASGLHGDVPALGQAGAMVVGLALSGLGYARGRIDLALGRTPQSLTRGL
jgi:glucosyl-dolichyl phosphate glucuronosyltransferase